MDEQRPENYLSVPEHGLTTYEDEKTIIHVSFPIYQVHTVDPMLFCVDIGAPHSYIRDEALERIISHSGRRSFPKIDSKRDFKFLMHW